MPPRPATASRRCPAMTDPMTASSTTYFYSGEWCPTSSADVSGALGSAVAQPLSAATIHGLTTFGGTARGMTPSSRGRSLSRRRCQRAGGADRHPRWRCSHLCGARLPRRAEHAAEHDDGADEEEPREQREDDADRPVGVAVRDEDRGEVERREDREGDPQATGHDRRPEQPAPRHAPREQVVQRPPEEQGRENEADEREHDGTGRVLDRPADGALEDQRRQHDDRPHVPAPHVRPPALLLLED